jgi:hypothetical protein
VAEKSGSRRKKKDWKWKRVDPSRALRRFLVAREKIIV